MELIFNFTPGTHPGTHMGYSENHGKEGRPIQFADGMILLIMSLPSCLYPRPCHHQARAGDVGAVAPRGILISLLTRKNARNIAFLKLALYTATMVSLTTGMMSLCADTVLLNSILGAGG